MHKIFFIAPKEKMVQDKHINKRNYLLNGWNQMAVVRSNPGK
jgi:hypothetical protein